MTMTDIPLLSQRDPRWAAQRLGVVNGQTIGLSGCIITCMTMLANYYGHTITPAQMDDWLTANNGYVSGDLYTNEAFSREFPDCSFTGEITCTNVPAPLDRLDSELAAKHPVVICVDFDHNPGDGIQTHFVLVVAKSGSGDYLINDPWFGDQTSLRGRYGDPATAILQLNMFSGPLQSPVQPPAPAPDTSKYAQYVQLATDPNQVKLQVDGSWYERQALKGIITDKTIADKKVVALTQQLADYQKAPATPSEPPKPSPAPQVDVSGLNALIARLLALFH